MWHFLYLPLNELLKLENYQCFSKKKKGLISFLYTLEMIRNAIILYDSLSKSNRLDPFFGYLTLLLQVMV